jgi:hypothetical protein
MSQQQETAPLLGGRNGSSGSGGSTFYFQSQVVEGGETSQYNQSTSDNDGGHVVETLPPGASAKDFEPRALGAVVKVRRRTTTYAVVCIVLCVYINMYMHIVCLCMYLVTCHYSDISFYHYSLFHQYQILILE